MPDLMQDSQLTTTMAEYQTKLLNVLDQMLAALQSLSENERFNQNFVHNTQEQAKVLEEFINYIKSGTADRPHSIMTMELTDDEHALMTMKLLSSYGIPYIANDTQSGKIFMYKDSDSKRVIEIAKEAEVFVRDKGRELDYIDFRERVMKEGDFYKLEKASELDVALFRREADMSKTPFTFTVKQDSDGAFTILANNKEALAKTYTAALLLKNETVLPSDVKASIKSIVEEDRKREQFLQTAASKSYETNSATFIIDKNKPDTILEIENGSYRIHSLNFFDDKGVKDKPSIYTKPLSHDIFSDMELYGFTNPAIVSEEEIKGLISGKGQSSEFKFTATGKNKTSFLEAYNNLELSKLPNEQKLALDTKVEDYISRPQAGKNMDFDVYTKMSPQVLQSLRENPIPGVSFYDKNGIKELVVSKGDPAARDALTARINSVQNVGNEKPANILEAEMQGRSKENLFKEDEVVVFNWKTGEATYFTKDALYKDVYSMDDVSSATKTSFSGDIEKERLNAINTALESDFAIAVSPEEYSNIIDGGDLAKDTLDTYVYTAANSYGAQQEALKANDRAGLLSEKLLNNKDLDERTLSPEEQNVFREFESKSQTIKEEKCILEKSKDSKEKDQSKNQKEPDER